MPQETPADKKSQPDWDGIAARPAFHVLLAKKARFLWAGTIFFLVYYFALLVLVGWWPELMKKQVLGVLNVAYLFALSQFIMAWVMAAIYVKKAAQWDKDAAKVLEDKK
ncbi:MAG: DUF485 domain-containing protein [Roseimicrobium sp.]